MKRLGFWPIVAFILLAVPLLMMAFPQPPAGNTGAPGDGTCNSCHSGVSTGGSVVATFPGTTYTPGVAQHVTVTVNDTTHAAWSFQMTARLASNLTGGQAGSFTATDTVNTAVVSSGTIQDMETTASGINQKAWSFNWTPPATNAGNVNFYLIGLAAGGAGGGATSGNGIFTAQYVQTPAASATPDFSLSASPTSLTVAQGASGSSTITVTPKNGFNGTVAFTASGLLSGVTASFSTAGVMTLAASSTAATGTSTVTVTGTSGSLSHTTTVALTVSAATAQPDFSLSASPSIVAISEGTSGTSTITVNPLNGFTGTVALTASGLPTGVTASFSTAHVLTLSASSTATAGTSTVTVTGTSGSLTHTTTITLSVSAVAAPDFNLSASPASLSIAQGSSGTSTITIAPQNGFSGTVALTASGAPTGVTASLSTAHVLTLAASSTAATGTSTVTITGTSGSLTHTTTVALTVASPVSASLSATPSALSLAYQIGGTAPATQSINVTTTGTVTYSVATTGGSWLSAKPTSGSSSGPVTVSVSPTGLTAGTYNGTVTITASGATGSPQNVKVTLMVTPAGASSLTVNPSALNFNSLSSGGDDAGEGSGSQRLAITSTTGAAVSYTTKETTQSGGNWLMLGSSGGTTPGTLMVSVNSRGLVSGIYHGTITITPSGTATGPQMVPVTLTVGTPTTSSLHVTPRRLTFSYSGTNDSGSKTVRVTSDGGAREFSAAAFGGSWLTVSPTSATTPATLTVSADARGLSMGTYSGMITLTAGTRKTYVYVTVYVATSTGGGGELGGEAESELAIQPIVNDPTNSDTVGAALLDAAGVPVSSQSASNTGNVALALSKTAHAPAGTSAGAQLVPAENLTKLTELGFDVRQGGHCTANSPHFLVVTSDDITHVLTGCANGTIQTAPAQGWIRVRFDPANPAQASPPVAPGQQIKSITIVLDEGPEATPKPGGGLVVLDNIDVNGVIVGKD